MTLYLGFAISIWLFSGVGVGVLLSSFYTCEKNSTFAVAMTTELCLEIAGVLVGLLYLYYEYKASALLWIAGVIMPALSLVVYYNAGLYADLAINIYYMFAAVYGWIAWQFYKKDDKPAEMPVSKMPRPFYVPAALITVALTATLSFVLAIFTDSTVPVWDSFTTALSVVAMWMLSRKYVEQWLLWVVVDIVSAGLYIYKGIYFYAALYALYAVVAIFGYINWKKMMHAND